LGVQLACIKNYLGRTCRAGGLSPAVSRRATRVAPYSGILTEYAGLTSPALDILLTIGVFRAALVSTAYPVGSHFCNISHI
jgi:hypothetical protein